MAPLPTSCGVCLRAPLTSPASGTPTCTLSDLPRHPLGLPFLPQPDSISLQHKAPAIPLPSSRPARGPIHSTPAFPHRLSSGSHCFCSRYLHCHMALDNALSGPTSYIRFSGSSDFSLPVHPQPWALSTQARWPASLAGLHAFFPENSWGKSPLCSLHTHSISPSERWLLPLIFPQ